ncbi:MAG: hypothetical protein FJX22_00520 [Alphaproteobacteria bacterium]|nr:hypothetical protein [Alphaproteobacteria bacterium]
MASYALGQKPPQELFLDDDLLPLLDSGEKTVSIHLGWLDIPTGDLVFRTHHCDASRLVTVIAIRHTSLEEVTEELALKDGHPGLESMKQKFAVLNRPPYEVRVTLIYFIKSDGADITPENGGVTETMISCLMPKGICGL